ncbi:hypothetical protein EDB87DRAFT_206128 [Lactarius vividus]|nr:hypothetical protein EDB87DRAFT_206128 [Lactarius vividus]
MAWGRGSKRSVPLKSASTCAPVMKAVSGCSVPQCFKVSNRSGSSQSGFFNRWGSCPWDLVRVSVCQSYPVHNLVSKMVVLSRCLDTDCETEFLTFRRVMRHLLKIGHKGPNDLQHPLGCTITDGHQSITYNDCEDYLIGFGSGDYDSPSRFTTSSLRLWRHGVESVDKASLHHCWE